MTTNFAIAGPDSPLGSVLRGGRHSAGCSALSTIRWNVPSIATGATRIMSLRSKPLGRALTLLLALQDRKLSVDQMSIYWT